MQTPLFLLASLLYLVCAFLPGRHRLLAAGGTALAWLCHGLALGMMVLLPETLRVGFALIVSSTLWISAGAYWLENRDLSFEGLRALILPCVAVGAVLPLLFPGAAVPLGTHSPWFAGHMAVALLAYSTLTIAAFHAVLMALQESRLHGLPTSGQRGWLTSTLDRLPPLLTMEKLLFRLIALGFFLLSLTVLSGIVFSEELFGVPFKWDHKIIFTLMSWALFGVLLAGRYLRGWRGKTALRFILMGFTTLLLAYVGSRFVLEVILHRSPL